MSPTMETWLAPNRRALLWGMLLPALAALAAGAAALGGWIESLWLRGAAALLGAVMVALLVGLLWQLRLPRIGYRRGELLFYLRNSTPYAVPAQVVECFFIGQGPTLRPGETYPDEQTVTVVARLAERATDYHRRDVKRALGAWCDGYITIRGTWCEPLDGERVKQLNHQLAAAHRSLAAARKEHA